MYKCGENQRGRKERSGGGNQGKGISREKGEIGYQYRQQILLHVCCMEMSRSGADINIRIGG